MKCICLKCSKVYKKRGWMEKHAKLHGDYILERPVIQVDPDYPPIMGRWTIKRKVEGFRCRVKNNAEKNSKHDSNSNVQPTVNAQRANTPK